MRRITLLLLLWIMAAEVKAQQTVNYDSSYTAVNDSIPVGSKQKSAAEWRLALEPALQRVVSFPEQNRYFFEEFVELFENWPGLQKVKLGDVGYPTFIALNGLPARFSSLDFDDILWPGNIYGQINFTTLPETFADWIVMDPAQERLSVFSNARPVNTTWTYFEYVDGPFGSDGLRVRFRRPLGKRWRTSWSATFANAEPYLPPTIGREEAFDTQKYFGLTEFDLNPQKRTVLQHRFVKSVTERGIVEPIFFEEWPGTQSAREKVYRLSHQFDWIKRNEKTEPALDRPVEDWRIGFFYWDLREEFRDDGRSSLIQHRRQLLGLRGLARWQRGAWLAKLAARWQILYIDSETLRENRIHGGRIAINLGRALAAKWRVKSRIAFHYRTPHGMAADVDAGLEGNIRPNMGAGFNWRRKTIFPEVGEYANAIPDIMTANLELQPFKYSAFQGQFRTKSKALEFQAAFAYYSLSRVLTVASADSLLQMQNEPRILRYPAAEFMFNWRALKSVRIRLWMTQQFRRLYESYFFWYLPSSFLRTETEFRFVLFGGDLPGAGVVRLSYYGPRIAPAADGKPISIQPYRIEGFWQLDAVLRLHFRDAIIFLNLDNLLNQRALWRNRQPIRGRTFRLGINWMLLD